MKKKLNRKGFTLVELIVVIAILAILAGVAIPVYSGYIQKAQEAADLQLLDSIKTAAVFAVTDERVPNATTINQITLDGKKVVVTVSGTDSTYGNSGAGATVEVPIEDYTGTLEFKYITGATWTPASGWDQISHN